MRKKIEIGEKEFVTKKDALNHFKTILNSYEIEGLCFYIPRCGKCGNVLRNQLATINGRTRNKKYSKIKLNN